MSESTFLINEYREKLTIENINDEKRLEMHKFIIKSLSEQIRRRIKILGKIDVLESYR